MLQLQPECLKAAEDGCGSKTGKVNLLGQFVTDPIQFVTEPIQFVTEQLQFVTEQIHIVKHNRGSGGAELVVGGWVLDQGSLD